MPSVKPVGGKVQIEIEKFDGGLNTNFSPNIISPYESPDCLNVVFDAQGSVATRPGCSYFNTSTTEIGSHAIDGIASYNGTMVVWAGGSMYRASGTTFVTVASAQSQFAAGSKVAHEIYQSVLFMSDGTNGPYRYTGGSDFYRMGIAVPSAPTGVSNTPGANQVETGTYYYKVAYVNTAVVEGQAGSSSAGITVATTAAINVTEIPTAPQSHGVSDRYIYRASTTGGTFRYIGTLAGNVASTFTDTVGAATWAVGNTPVTDGTSPTPFSTIKLHKERLFFPNNADKTILKWTEYGNPYISEAENFEPLNKGDGSNIIAIGVQQDLVTSFKNDSFWVSDLVDPADDTTWIHAKAPGNLGIVGPRALCEIQGALIIVGKRANRITGFHMITGIDTYNTTSVILRADTISKAIENDIFSFPSSYWQNIALMNYKERIFSAVTRSADTTNKNIYWFDTTRVQNQGQIDADPGSWSLWSGRAAQISCFVSHSGVLYGGSSQADGRVLTENVEGQWNDAGAAINSYYWSAPVGGDETTVSWIKDFRLLNLWYYLLGAWNMRVNYRLDGDSSDGNFFNVDLTPGGTVWNSFTWGVQNWGGGITNFEKQFPTGPLLGRRVQIKFSNNNTLDTAFKVHSLKLLVNMRRQR